MESQTYIKTDNSIFPEVFTEFAIDKLVKAISRNSNYERSIIQRDFLQVLANGLASHIIYDEDFDHDVYRWCPKDRHKTHYCVKALFDSEGTAYGEDHHSTHESGAQERVITEMICNGARLSLDFVSETCIDLPLNFQTQPSGDFIILKDLMELYILPHLDTESLRSLAMVCKWTNDIVNNFTLSGIAIKCARDYASQALRINIEVNSDNDDYEYAMLQQDFLRKFMIYSANVCTDISNKIFTKKCQICVNNQNSHFEILKAIDHGEATIIDNPEANCDSYMKASLRKGFLINIDSKLYTVCIEFRRMYSGFRHAKWEKLGNRLGNNIAAQDVDIGPINTSIRIKRSVMKLTEETDLNKQISFMEILKSATCFSHESPHESQLPHDELSSYSWSLEDVCLLSNRSKEDVLKFMQCTEDEFNNYRDYDEWEDLGEDEQSGVTIKTIELFRSLIQALVNMSIEGDLGGLFVETLQRIVKPKDNFPLQTVKFKPREWSLFSEGTISYSDREEKMMMPVNWYNLFTRKDTMNDGYIVFQW